MPRGACYDRRMNTLKDEAIVLRKLDYSESSQVLALFTRDHGKARVIAKGIKRSTRTRFAPAMDLLERGHVVLSVRTARQEALAILTEWKQTRAHSGLRDRLAWLYAAQYGSVLTAELTEDWDPHPLLFDALAELLGMLEGAKAPLVLVVSFQRRLLEEIGLAPEFESCIGCRRAVPFPGEIHFTSLEGGLLCRDCEGARAEKRGVSLSALPWLRGVGGESPGLRAAFDVLDYHLSHLMGKPHPLGRMLLQACGI